MASADIRFCVGFALLAAWLFGGIGYSFYLTFTWRPWTALLVLAVTWAVGCKLPRPISWLVMLGHKAKA